MKGLYAHSQLFGWLKVQIIGRMVLDMVTSVSHNEDGVLTHARAKHYENNLILVNVILVWNRFEIKKIMIEINMMISHGNCMHMI